MSAALLLLMASTQLSIPDGQFMVAYRQLNKDGPAAAIHQLTLRCKGGSCTLITLTLNQCMNNGQNDVFYPAIEIASTDTGSLVIESGGPSHLTVRDGVVTYRFDFETRSLGSIRQFTRLLKLSGGAVKDSAARGEVISWGLAPLAGQNGWATVTLDCAVLLETVPN